MTGSPDGSLKDKTVLVVGRGSGLARAIALAAVDAGTHVVAAGRNQETLPAAAYTLARSLALELARIRVNAISPGVIDTGAWDALASRARRTTSPT